MNPEPGVQKVITGGVVGTEGLSAYNRLVYFAVLLSVGSINTLWAQYMLGLSPLLSVSLLNCS